MRCQGRTGFAFIEAERRALTGEAGGEAHSFGRKGGTDCEVVVFAYLASVCFSKEQDAEANSGTVELVTQNKGVIH